MYEVLPGYPVEVFTVYITFFGACIVASYLFKYVFSAVSKGIDKWKS